MKSIRKFILTTILIIIALILCMSNKAFAAYSIGNTLSISENSMSTANNIYCVSYGKHFGGIKGMNYNFNFRVAAYVELEGKKASGVSSSGATIECENDDNATLAAILGGPLQKGYGSYNNYHEAQMALYTFWNTWVGSVGGQYGFSADSANGNVNGSAYVQKAKDAAVETDYKAVVYLLVPTGEATAYNVQELITVDVLTPENPSEQPEQPEAPGQTTVTGYVNISGYVWEDIANSKSNTVNSKYEDGDKRLEGIVVHWKDKNGGELASTTTGADGSYTLTTTLDLYNHPYGIKDKEKYDKINNSYIEFEYNGLKYTTVAYNGNLSDETTSKGKENPGDRVALDNKFDRVEDETVWDGNNAIISGLPNTKITDANYAQEFATTASTGNIVRGLLNISEANSWTETKTFCSNHCTADYHEHVVATVEIDRIKNKILDHTEKIYQKDSNGNKVYDPDTGEPIVIGTEDIYRDAVLYLTKYCYGDSTTADFSGDTGYFNLSNYSLKAPIGDEFNNYSGVHYYSANETDGPTTRDCLESVQGIYIWNIYNMNLGLVRREQPDAALTSDIEKVRVVMKGQEYTYIYGNRGIQNNEELFDYKVKFGNKYMETYSRPVNPADIAYVNYNNSDDLKVYVTYNIIAKNQSATLPMTINKIVNYYDSDYTIYTGNGTATSSGWTDGGTYNNEYKMAYYTGFEGIKIEPQGKTEIAKIEFEISQDAIKGLLNNDATLYNVSEIFSYTTYYGANTICAELETAAAKGKTGQQYAGLDLDSTPGTAVPGNLDTYEDDTDKAPSFLLMKDPNYKTMTGIVYEDTQTTESKNNNERLGNGQRDNGEKGVANVKVELLNVDGTPAYLYYKNSEGKADKKLAVTYTDENGNYSFGSPNESGVVVDNYIIKYTYGNDTTVLTNGSTKINGNEINARNYKSTIITESNVKGVMQGNNSDKWHLYMDRNIDSSIAVDDINERLAIPSLKYSNFDTPVNMSAYSKPFKIQVEYTPADKQESKVDNDGGTFEHDWEVFDFGIIERAREDIVIEKTISKIKITLANGQVIIDGVPTDPNANIAYTKPLGFKNRITDRESSLNALDKLLSIEMDSELMQGSTMEVWYAITVSNNSEKDYEYETDAKYYYYGDSTGLGVLSKTVELVADYMDPELSCEVGDNAKTKTGDIIIDNKEWHMYDSSTSDFMTPDNSGTPIIDIIKEHGYVSSKVDSTDTDKTYEALTNGQYSIFVTETFNGVTPGSSKTSTLYASKLLGNKEEEHSYENHVEIIQLNSKIARTIDRVKDDTREQVVKTYKPGNYIPSLADRTTNADGTLELEGLHQPDDDRVKIIITPPTGILNYITIYIIATVVALIVIVGGVIFIKKKVMR